MFFSFMFFGSKISSHILQNANMKLLVRIIIPIFIIVCFSLNTFAESKTDLKTLLFIPLKKNDFSFSQAAYQGYVKLKKEGYTIDYIENADSLSNGQILNLIRQYHLKGYKAYILAGNEFSHVVTLAAQQYPDNFFATLAGNAHGNNVINYCFDCLSPGGYYAGKAALRLSKNDIIGFVGGLAPVDGPSAAIFKQTILANKPNAKVLISWTNNWSDIKDAETLTEEQIKAGADIIVASANTGVITAASKYPNVKIIGWMVDISPLSSNVAASAVINTAVAYQMFLSAIEAHKFQGGTYKANLTDGIWGIETARSAS